MKRKIEVVKEKKWYKKWKIMIPLIFSIMIIINILVTKTAELTYEVPATEAVEYQPAVYEQIPAETYEIPVGTSTVGEDVEIPNGTYDITCSSGSGNVVARGVRGDLKLNEIMATYSDDFFLDKYNNYKLKQGDSFETDCNLILTGENTEKLVTPEVEAVPATEAYNRTEKVKLVNGETETCYIDNEEVDCNELVKYDVLKEEISND